MISGFHSYLRDKALVKEEHLPLLMELVSTKQISKGELLLSKDQICKHSFFIEKGIARMYSIDESGKEHIIQFAMENWFITDRDSVYFGKPSAFFIDVIEDASVVFLDHPFIENASSISPEFRNYNEYILQNHIRHLQNRINLLIGADAEKRYKELLKLYPGLMQRVPQWMIASYLGITPESLSRVRKELVKRAS